MSKSETNPLGCTIDSYLRSQTFQHFLLQNYHLWRTMSQFLNHSDQSCDKFLRKAKRVALESMQQYGRCMFDKQGLR
jgi:hypothetical protein